MLNDKNIRLATVADGEAILAIYAPFIRETVFTFEYEVPSVLEFRDRIADIIKQYPWLVCEINGKIVGYAYASKFSERRAYDWSADASIYIHPDFHRQKIASALYYALFEILKLQGYYNVYVGITSANIISDRFHESFGFKPVGTYRHVGFKLGKWYDVKWAGLTLIEPSGSPQEPKTIHTIKNTLEYQDIISKALHIIKE
jgi:phosphinothricin acetyltransferase